jgi:transposase InsO family protein
MRWRWRYRRGFAPAKAWPGRSTTATGPAQYLAIRYTSRLAEAGAITSVGSKGDSYDNALAETIIGLRKAELIAHRGPWHSLSQVEAATAWWTGWFNNRRLYGPLGDIPPAEYEQNWLEGKAP